MPELRLKKDFYVAHRGDKVIIESFGQYKPDIEILWYNVVDKGGAQLPLGNSITMNVDEWIEEVPEEKTLEEQVKELQNDINIIKRVLKL